jgi:hypothetical protein
MISHHNMKNKKKETNKEEIKKTEQKKETIKEVKIFHFNNIRVQKMKVFK